MASRVERLRKRADFVRLNQLACKAVTRTLVLQSALQPETTSLPSPVARLGFTTSKKLGNAVNRNRIRRRLKAAADEVLHAEMRPGHDYVIIGRHSALEESYEGLLRDMRYALKRVHAALDSKEPQQSGGSNASERSYRHAG